MNIKNVLYFVAVTLAASNGLSLLKAEQDSAPCISIGSIVGAVVSTSLNERDNRTIAIRDHLASELMNRYECTVLSRCRGYDVAIERSIDGVAGINELQANPAVLPAADYVVMANFNEAQTGNAITGTVFCARIKAAGTNDVLKKGFFVENTLDAAESMAEAVGTALALAPRKKVSNTASVKGQVWAVFPFTRMEDKNVFDSGLAARVEVALQESNSGIKLVDRNLLEKVLKENNMETLSGASGMTAGMIGRFLSADILVVGQVSLGKKNRRLDIHFLDGKTGSILAAQVARDVAPDQLAAAAVKCVNEAAGGGIVVPQLRVSSKEERLKEAEILVSTDFYPSAAFTDKEMLRMRWTTRASVHEGAYLLAKDEPMIVYSNMVALVKGLEALTRGLFRDDYDKIPVTGRAMALIEYALKPIEVSDQTPAVLIFRAENAIFARKYDDGLRLLNKHNAEHPLIEADLARRVMATYKLKTGRIDEAEALMKQVKENSFVTLALNDEIKNIRNRKGEAVAASKGEQEEYVFLGKLFASSEQARRYKSNEHYGRLNSLLRYFELMRKIETPKQCLEKADVFCRSEVGLECSRSGYDMFAVTMHRALCHLELGEKKEAAVICKHIVESVDTVLTFKYEQIQKIRKQAADIVAKVTAEAGPVGDPWKTLSQVKPLPVGSGIYLVPFGKMKKEILDKTVKILADNFGMTVKVLPELPVPSEAVQVKEGGFLQVAPLYQGLIRATAIPADAVFVAFVTGERIPYPVRLDGKFAYPFNPFLGSYHDRWVNDTDVGLQAAADSLAWRVMGMVTYPERKRGSFNESKQDFGKPCLNFPCIFSGQLGHLLGKQYRISTMCPACQEEWKKADFERIHDDLMGCLKKAGAKIVKAGDSTVTVKGL